MSEHDDLEDDLSPSLRAQLMEYDPGSPSGGLSDRVVAAARSKKSARAWRFGLVAAAAAVVLGMGLRAWRVPSSGVHVATVRASLALGGRGIAVVEVGARVKWSVAADGAASVEQEAGRVFYRVERGEPFGVKTPAGEVVVKGTCFTVEVEPMRVSKQGMTGAVMGAALTAAVVVTVHEGKVLFANERGSVELAAGDRARSSDSGPRRISEGAAGGATMEPAPAEDTTREELFRRDQAQRGEISVLRDKLASLEGSLKDSNETLKKDKRENPVDPSPEELKELASQCRIGYDVPTVALEPSHYGDSLDADLGLTAEEKSAVTDVHQKFNDRMLAQLRKLYTEATGDAKAADVLSPRSLEEEILAKAGSKEETQLVLQRLSHERAGLAPPPASFQDASVIERYYRTMMAAGEGFERDIGQVIGPERARDARKKHGGWNGKHGTSRGCPGDK